MKLRLKKNDGRQIKGFSLVELMVVISIAAILVSLAVPSFQTMLRNQRLTTAVADFFSATILARSEALNLGRSVLMTPLDPSKPGWNSGWQVFVDEDNDGVYTPNTSDRLVLSHGPVPNEIDTNSNFGDSKDYIMYSGSGRSRSKTSADSSRSGKVYFSVGGVVKRGIVFSFLGRARVCDATIVNDCS